MAGRSKGTETPLPMSQLNLLELTLNWVNRHHHTCPLAIPLASSGRIDVQPLTTHHLPFAETTQALTLAQRGQRFSAGDRAPTAVASDFRPGAAELVVTLCSCPAEYVAGLMR